MRKCMMIAAVAAAAVLVCGSGTQADVVVDWDTVGNPGNANDAHGDGDGNALLAVPRPYHSPTAEDLGFSFRVAKGPEPGTLYVDNDASLGGDGLSWDTAYTYLQDALSVAAAPESEIIEIRVAQGVCHPDLDEAGNVTLGDRQATFQLIDGVAVLGGYRGCPGGDCGRNDPDDRDIVAFETVLSGDLTDNDGPDFANNSENSYHVTTGGGTDTTAILNGFTISAGNADGSGSTDEGGGMYNYYSSPTVTDCAFSANSATLGGGMCNISSSPMVTHCMFSKNSTGSNGGGLYNDDSSPMLTNCTFSGNSAGTNGGGMYNEYDCNPTLVNCTFSGNSATSIGGGMYIFRGEAEVANCTFSENSASVRGGGMYNRWGSPALTSCILWGNTAPTGPQISVYSGGTSVTYSCIQDGWSGTGNIGDLPEHDPLFIDADGADDIAGTADDDLRLSVGSPCIDAGSNMAVPLDAADLDQDDDTAERTPLDMDGNPRFVDDPDTTDTGLDDLPDYPEIVDMGAYEYQAVSDCNDNGVPDEDDIANGTSLDCNENGIPDECEYPGCDGILSADMNCDEMTDGADVQGFTNYLVADRYTCQADMNDDGFVDENDILLFVDQLLGL